MHGLRRPAHGEDVVRTGEVVVEGHARACPPAAVLDGQAAARATVAVGGDAVQLRGRLVHPEGVVLRDGAVAISPTTAGEDTRSDDGEQRSGRAETKVVHEPIMPWLTGCRRPRHRGSSGLVRRRRSAKIGLGVAQRCVVAVRQEWGSREDGPDRANASVGEDTVTDTTSNAGLQAMIERAGRITADEAEALDVTWKADEGIVLPEPSASLAIQGGADGRMVTNADLVAAWQHALEAAGAAGRVEEIEAAQEAGRAVRHSDARLRDRAGAEEAVRSAVLATGVRDLVSDDEFATLTAAWRKVLGEV